MIIKFKIFEGVIDESGNWSRKGFRMEDFLVKVSDVEVDAMKYNI